MKLSHDTVSELLTTGKSGKWKLDSIYLSESGDKAGKYLARVDDGTTWRRGWGDEPISALICAITGPSSSGEVKK